jgi:hypothetical protein
MSLLHTDSLCIFSRHPQKIIGEFTQLVDEGVSCLASASIVHSNISTVGLERNLDEGENSPKLKTSVGWRVQRWGVVPDGVLKEQKGRKGWER